MGWFSPGMAESTPLDGYLPMEELCWNDLIWPAGSQTQPGRQTVSEKDTGFIKSCHRFSRAALLDCKEQGVIGEYVEVS